MSNAMLMLFARPEMQAPEPPGALPSSLVVAVGRNAFGLAGDVVGAITTWASGNRVLDARTKQLVDFLTKAAVSRWLRTR